jgi:hypothetical protein
MSSVLVPVAPGIPDQQFKCQLESETFGLRFYWNPRAGMWFLDISDAAGDIADGLPVPLGVPLCHLRLSDERLPKGEAIAVDTSGQGLEPGAADLGDRVQVVYIESSDL